MSVSARRADLLELTSEALTALANAGFVKKAQKELEEGKTPELLETAEGEIQARFSDGQLTRLPPGRSLRDAICSCPASGLCRHRVMLVLAYQRQATMHAAAATPAAGEAPAPAEAATAWSPACFLSALDSLPAATLEQAGRLAEEQPVLRLTAWQAQAPAPMARLPMCTVRFYSRTSLAHARCDCRQGSGCAHIVLAVRAFAHAEARQPGFRELSLAAPPVRTADAGPDPAAARLADELAEARAELDGLALSLWLDGTGQPPLGLESRYAALRHRLDTLGWCWAVEELALLWQGIAAQHARSSRYDPLRLLMTLSGLQARLAAAAHAVVQARAGGLPPAPAAQILGVGIRGEVALDHLRLVSLGTELWCDEASEGVRLAYADPDTLAVTVIERQWPLAPDGEAPAPLAGRRIAGHPVRALAAGQIVTRAARRRANGLLEISPGARHSNVLPLSPRAWDDLGAPLRQVSMVGLRACLQDAGPDFVRPSQVIEHLHILPVAAVLDWGWEAATQTVHARLRMEEPGGDDPESEPLYLESPYAAAAPGAVDALARALSGEYGEPAAVAGRVRLESGRVVVTPLAWLTRSRMLILATETGLAFPLTARPVRAAVSPGLERINETRQLLALWLRQGLRHQGAAALGRVAEQAAALRAIGLMQAAVALESLPALLQAADRQVLPGRLSALAQWLAEMAREI